MYINGNYSAVSIIPPFVHISRVDGLRTWAIWIDSNFNVSLFIVAFFRIIIFHVFVESLDNIVDGTMTPFKRTLHLPVKKCVLYSLFVKGMKSKIEDSCMFYALITALSF